MPELVSILIPAYNAAKWLSTTVRSALTQTWPRVEIIIVDDGSKDDTLAVAKRWEGPSVKVVTQDNSGAAAARNRALELAQGTYIQYLDADDLLDPDKISAHMRVAGALSDRRVLLSCPFGTFFYRSQKAVFTPTLLWRDLTPIEYFLTRFEHNTCFQTDAWLVSRELIEAAGPWTDFDSPDDDGEYFCRVAMNSTSVKFVPEARTYYRVGNVGSLANVRSQKALKALYGSKVKCIRYLLSIEDSARTRAASVRLLQDWMPDFYAQGGGLTVDARRLAAELGGELQRPELKWKYRPAEWLFGYDTALSVSRVLRRVRARAGSKLDECLYRLSSATAAEPPLQLATDRAK